MCKPTCFKDIYTNYYVCDRRPTVSINEKGKTYLANNRDLKEIAQYHVDDSSETATGKKRCDYAIYIFDEEDSFKNDDRLIFIELKGSNISRAIEQIQASFKEIVKDADVAVSKVDARVIASKNRYPDYYSAKAVALRKELKRYGKGDLINLENPPSLKVVMFFLVLPVFCIFVSCQITRNKVMLFGTVNIILFGVQSIAFVF